MSFLLLPWVPLMPMTRELTGIQLQGEMWLSESQAQHQEADSKQMVLETATVTYDWPESPQTAFCYFSSAADAVLTSRVTLTRSFSPTALT